MASRCAEESRWLEVGFAGNVIKNIFYYFFNTDGMFHQMTKRKHPLTSHRIMFAIGFFILHERFTILMIIGSKDKSKSLSK